MADNIGDQDPGALPYFVSLYHAVCIVGSIWIAVQLLGGERWIGIHGGQKHQLLALDLGVLGGALNASRYVVYSVRHREYDRQRFLWQVMTPLYSAALAWVGFFAVAAGVITLSVNSARPDSAGGILNSSGLVEPQFTAFVMSFSFLVGFASESFVKRLIMAAESLFGERGDLDGKNDSNPRGS